MTSHRELAELEFHQRRYFLAAKFAQYALAEDDEDYATQRILGLSCLSLGELDLGIESLEQAALLRPLDVSAQIELAIAYGQAGRKGLSRDLLMAQATSGLLAPSELLRVAIGLEAV